MGRLCVAGLAVVLLGCSESSADVLEPEVLEPIEPQIEVGNFDALIERVESYRGTPLLLNWWAMWCPPCVAEQPELLEVAREMRERGGAVIGISDDLNLPDVTVAGTLVKLRQFIVQRRVNIPVFLFDDVDPFAVIQYFGLPGPIPVTLAVDAEGNIVDRHEGQANRARFVEMMEKALGG